MRHPLHLLAIVGGLAAFAVGFWTGYSDNLLIFPLGLAFMSAVDLARRLGLEPPNDPAASHNRKGL
ncbi:hypothetical protein [Brevundimonas sp.]|uniref:hypothetical protein n=1 Tax=Brevundimonas sp. TaxID=1871086 RepID=UPI0025D0B212|nr:hypothetical protein [Brevundimonas sp.]